ncbi:MAG TPA: response regulator [Vicinamibacterales bacterium]|nr:response regulator [Vicinamibacterales bacterium]
MTRAPHILLVDDDPDLVEILRILLEDCGYSVRCARNGREALESVAQERPAVILLDMLMPVMDGWRCAREVRARYGRGVPIVVVTAAENARARANTVGSIDEVLAKPFDIQELLRIVDRYVPKPQSGEISYPDS